MPGYPNALSTPPAESASGCGCALACLLSVLARVSNVGTWQRDDGPKHTSVAGAASNPTTAVLNRARTLHRNTLDHAAVLGAPVAIFAANAPNFKLLLIRS